MLPQFFVRHVALQTGHLAAMQQTADFKRKSKTTVDIRRRIKQKYEWLQVNYYTEEYCEGGGVLRLTQEQVLDPTEHHFNN
jgi:hypothetical protein